MAVDTHDLQRALGALPFVTRLHLHEVIGSTNDEIRRLAREGSAAWTVVVADEQTRGRGRLGRAWHSPPRLGLYLSVLLRPQGTAESVLRWTLGAAVAACAACRSVSGCGVEIEWPNDLVVGGRKIGGMLAEVRGRAGAGHELALGFGINVHHAARDFPQALAASASSLSQESGASRTLSRAELAASILVGLHEIDADLAAGRWDVVSARWTGFATGARGRRVRVVASSAAEGFEGRTAGIDESGALRVVGDDGRIRCVRMVESVVAVES